MIKHGRLISVFCLVLILAVPTIWIWYSWSSIRNIPPTESGYMDLREWSFLKQGPVRLTGEWEFYAGQLLKPEDFGKDRKPVPSGLIRAGAWNKHLNPSSSSPYGYGTYRILLNLEGQAPGAYGIHTSILRTANKIYLNGQEAGSSGITGPSAEEHLALNKPYIGFVQVDQPGALELIMQISNYDYATGGMIYPIKFGDQLSVLKSRDTYRAMDIASAVGFSIPGVFFLLLYQLRRKEHYLLHISLFCMAAIVYVLTHGEKLLFELLPFIEYQWFTNLQQISSILAHYLLVRYVCSYSQAPNQHYRFLWFARAATVLQVLFVLATPVSIFSNYASWFFIVSLIMILYVTYVMYQWLRRRTGESLLLIMSVQSMIVVIAVSALNAFGLLADPILLPYELMLFVIAQALLVAIRFAGSMREVETLSSKLLVLNELKNDFIARTADELRIPVQRMMHLSQSMLSEASAPVDRKQSDQLEMISITGSRLSTLIEDMVDFAKLKHADVVLRKQPVDLVSVVQSVLEVFSPVIKRKKLRIVQSWPESLPSLDADEERLRQIIYNLVSNAVKYTDHGQITFSAYYQVDTKKVIVMVGDTGIGIAAERFAEIFEQFERTPAISRWESYGLGLGLSLTRKLVELHGGTIDVESQLGQGTQFRLVLPAAENRTSSISIDGSQEPQVQVESPSSLLKGQPSEGEGKADSQLQPGSNGRVMLVDDDPVSLQELVNLLSNEGYTLIPKRSGEEALSYLLQQPQVDLVVTDWMMPGMSGLELCRMLRLRFLLSELPVLMLTGRSRSEEVRVCFGAGANDILQKPVEGEALKARIRTLLQLRQTVQQSIRTEMAFLQAQIKPHFLYNSLNTIIATCPPEAEQAAELLIVLSEYLRSSFDFQNREQLSSLRKELALVRAYLSLEKARFDERLEVEWDIQVDEELLIPPLSIQPIVENAVGHGIMKKASGGRIMIRLLEDQGDVMVVIEDNGMGIPADKLAVLLTQQEHSKSVGLLNIHRRLLTLYGQGLVMESTEGQGTKVWFRIPRGGELR